jgi:pSer/pThr/pTyr-binding forkhead associated (FHA) protein
MVDLRVLSGKKAGTSWVARRFPVRIGRSPDSDLQIDDPGVWDQHLKIELRRGQGFVLSTQGDALASVNAQRVQETVLRNGDTIEIGASKLQFWLGQTRQRGLRLREWLTWSALAAICLGQIALIYFYLD